MDVDPQSGFAGGGVTLLLVVAYYAARMALDRLKERRKGERPGVTVAGLTDAATANGILINSMTALRDDNARLTQENERLSQRLADQSKRIAEQSDRITGLERKLAELQSRLDN